MGGTVVVGGMVVFGRVTVGETVTLRECEEALGVLVWMGCTDGDVEGVAVGGGVRVLECVSVTAGNKDTVTDHEEDLVLLMVSSVMLTILETVSSCVLVMVSRGVASVTCV